MVELKEAIYLWLDDLVQAELSGTLTYLGYTFGGMVHHILVNLHPASPAMKLLFGANTTIGGYMTATNDVVLAIWYLGVLVAFGVFLIRVIAIGIGVVRWVATPLRLLLVVLHWISQA